MLNLTHSFNKYQTFEGRTSLAETLSTTAYLAHYIVLGIAREPYSGLSNHSLQCLKPHALSTLHVHLFDSSRNELVISPTILLVICIVMKILEVNAGMQVLELILEDAMAISGQADNDLVAK
jgi:hypothetical protein